jgi:sulfoxide reductase heme-binding subunit YedZ
VSGAAGGSLVLAPGTSSDIVAHVWGATAAPSAPAAPSANDADPTLWYITRGAAITAYVLLVAVVALGIALGFRGFEGLVRGWRILDLHQVLTLAMLAFVGLHLVTLFLDPFKSFSLLQLLWPLGETYRPVWTVLGVLALYLLLAGTASSYLRRELGQRVWFALHLTSYVAFVLLTLHGFFGGTDSGTPWMLGIYAGASALVVLLTLGRVYVALSSRGGAPATPATEPHRPVGAPR